MEKSFFDQKNEFETYLMEKSIDADDKFEIFSWWKQNSSWFPIMSCMLRDILVTTVSMVAS